MEKSNKFIFTIALLLSIIIMTIAVFKINFLDDKMKLQQKQEEIKSDNTSLGLENIKDNYQNEIKSIIQEYILANNNIKIDNFSAKEENITQTIDKVMDLILTKEFKEFHLKLIIALNSVQEGYEMLLEGMSDGQKKVDFGFSELEQLIDEHPWLNN